LHLVAAMSLRPDLAGIVAYDARLIHAAMERAMPTASPGG
jgi:hypothetical protein